MSLNEKHCLVAIQFQYVGTETGYNFETLPFYLNRLRSFLEKHLGKVVWLKGALIEQPAYLLFLNELKPQVYEMLSRELEDGGSYKISPVKNPVELLRKYYQQERVAIGYLKNGDLELGAPSTLSAPLPINCQDGFWLNRDRRAGTSIFLKSDDAYVKMHEGEAWVCFLKAVELHCRQDETIAFIRKYPRLIIRQAALPSYQRLEPESDSDIVLLDREETS